MFIGHFGVGFAGKRLVPRVSFGTLVLSVQFIDLLWPLLLLAGLEHVRVEPGITAFTPLDFYEYPISHSLLSVLGWGLGFGLVYYQWKRDLRGAIILGVGVLSHWLLDFITHRPDLPLLPGSDVRVGLGLWNSVTGSFVVEGLIYAAGLSLYLRSTKPIDRTGTVALWTFAAFLVAMWVLNAFSPPPPGQTAIAVGSLSLWVLVAWAYWLDRHRKPSLPE